MKAYTSSTAIPHPRHLDPDGANPRVDFALGEITIAYKRLPPLDIPAVGILG